MSSHTMMELAPWCGQIIRTKRCVLYDETQLEPGMLGVVIAVLFHDEEVVEFQIDMRPFDAHNDTLLDKNYYDKDGVPCLTAKEAGHWEEIEGYYLDPKDIDSRLQILAPHPDFTELYNIRLGRYDSLCVNPNEMAHQTWKVRPDGIPFAQFLKNAQDTVAALKKAAA